MAGYAATGTVRGARVRARAPARREAPVAAEGPIVDEPPPSAVRPGPTWRERFADLRTAWSETTFYLFNDNGWR